MANEFTAFPRATEGRGASRRLRRSGRAPGIVYGGSATPQPIELDHNALIHALKAEAFHSSILTMKLDGQSQQVLLRDVQMHPFRREILHVDFQRVDATRRIHMKVPLHFINGENSPAVKLQGAIISHVLTELDVSCLPKDLPSFIEVDLSELALNQSIHVGNLKLPAGVTAVAHAGMDPVVATAIIPKMIVEEVPEVAAEAVEGEAVAPEGEAAAAAGTGEKPDEKGAEKTAEKGAEKGAERGGKKESKK
ncbi:MAG TPA: 50S ribosomal protein L25/general stress protein Ctc [Casimicrobiaceae bacterium]|nr:50S ribosomal protein L25/general stress protein Ctc [Casimicrobiaceae bacterium]